MEINENNVSVIDERKLIRSMAFYEMTPTEITEATGLGFQRVYHICRRGGYASHGLSLADCYELAGLLKEVSAHDLKS